MKPMQNIEDQVIAGNSNYLIPFPDSSLILIQGKLHILDKLFFCEHSLPVFSCVISMPFFSINENEMRMRFVFSYLGFDE
jgi:hypothetical protein